jgi:hypothetical protein
MKKEHADEWIKALRSGKYKQGRGRLYNKGDNTYCCLGVLNALHKNKLAIESNETLDPSKGVIMSSHGLFESTSATLTWLNDEGYPDSKGEQVADSLNFDEIADIIQMCWEEL